MVGINSFNLQTYISPKVLATCALYLRSKGIYCSNASKVGRNVLGIVADNAVADGIKPFLSTEEAIVWLRNNGFSLKQMDDPRRNEGLVRLLGKEALMDNAEGEQEGLLTEAKAIRAKLESGRAPDHNNSKEREGEHKNE